METIVKVKYGHMNALQKAQKAAQRAALNYQPTTPRERWEDKLIGQYD